MLNENPSIESVYSELTAWRSKKLRSNEKIPSAIWEQVRILFQTHKSSLVLKSLSLTTQQARDHGLLPPADNIEKNSFVKITVPSKTATSSYSPSCNLTIVRGDAICTISNPTLEQLQLVIGTFIGVR